MFRVCHVPDTARGDKRIQYSLYLKKTNQIAAKLSDQQKRNQCAWWR